MNRGSRKIREGLVVASKMDKTVVVEIKRDFRHPVFDKVVRKDERFKAHDEKKLAKVGDRVKIMETRPISKDKRWTVLEIVGAKKEAA